jgi:hypothetical protein
LADEQLATPSYARGWSIAQVLSHLGSAAEIGAVLVRRGIDGGPTGPGERGTKPVWQRWVPGLREGGGAGYVVASS